MWDRKIGKDLFQGNYSTCCIGMGRDEARAMPIYLLNTSYNMIELVNKDTDEIIGNALCFLAKDEDNNKPILIIDNVEISTHEPVSTQYRTQLKDAVVQYASNVANAISQKDDVKIYLGATINDIHCGNLDQVIKRVRFLGDVKGETTYMDLYGGWAKNYKHPQYVTLYDLNK